MVASIYRNSIWGANLTPRWPHEMVVRRTAQAMAGATAPLLSASKQIIFVDPHFSPSAQRFIRPLQAWLRVLEQCGCTSRGLEYHTLWDPKTDLTAYRRNFEANCRSVPTNWRLSVVSWRERPAGEKMHARHVLTDRAAVRFDIGLDEGREGENVPLTTLPYEHQRWLAVFNETASVFERHGPIPDMLADDVVEERNEG